jgi:RNA polymerase sigma-70 factor (ECF subfamily)
MIADLESIYRSESRHILATLIRLLGDVELAEDALHEAFLSAAEQWPREGVPRNPRSWLISTGRFQAIDIIRRRSRYDAAAQRLALQMERSHELDIELDHIPDDDLRLIFLCCHPALALDAQVALTLREACGLTTEEIARAFVARPSAIAQRIVRAKNKIREARIPYELPGPLELWERLQGVLHVIYLLFNEGYDASHGVALVRADLCTEAIRLGRLLAGLVPEPEICGLVALMMFHHARRAARTDANGKLVLLDDQDRSAWDHAEIAEAETFLQRALAAPRPGRYAYEAAIAQVHASAQRAGETKWDRIVTLYDGLREIEPSAVVELNRAAAIAMRDGPEAGLANLESILARGELNDYRFAHAARADLYRRLGRWREARAAYQHALSLTEQEAERRYLRERLAQLE